MLIPRRKIQVSHTETPLALAEMLELCHIPNSVLILYWSSDRLASTIEVYVKQATSRKKKLKIITSSLLSFGFQTMGHAKKFLPCMQTAIIIVESK